MKLVIFVILLQQLLVLVCSQVNYFRPSYEDKIRAKLVKNDTDCETKLCRPVSADLLSGRRKYLHASSVCGRPSPERYCVLGTKTQIVLKNSRSRQQYREMLNNNLEAFCHVCDSTHERSKNYHGIDMVVNGADSTKEREKKWWQSKNNVDNVYITLELENEFLFTHIIMQFKTFRPSAMFIEKSTDYGLTWSPIAYFADNCREKFPGVPLESNVPGVAFCKEGYSREIPSRGGQLGYQVLRPGVAEHVEIYRPDIFDALRVTNIRFNFTQLFRLGDQFLNEVWNFEDKYYYAVNEIKIYGMCLCYGHASECQAMEGINYDQSDLNMMVHGACRCKHNTDGLNCERCAPLYNDRPWAAANKTSANACKKCDCNGHAEECEFSDEEYERTGFTSGGICKCLHHTHGKNCEQCKVGFWQDPKVEYSKSPVACKACDCDLKGSLSEFCNTGTDVSIPIGQCFCKPNVDGRRCDRCKPGFRNLRADNVDGCEPCVCNVNGTLANEGCNADIGKCRCKPNVMGPKCDECKPDHYGLGDYHEGCKPCDCSIEGSFATHCDAKTGQCQCRPHMTGRRCDVIEPGHFCPNLDYLTYEAEDAQTFNDKVSVNDFTHSFRMHHGSRRLLIQEQGKFSIHVDALENGGLFDILVRYDAVSTWLLTMVITAVNKDFHLMSDICDKHDYDLTFYISPEARTHLTNAICFESGQEYEIKFSFLISQGSRQDPNDKPTILSMDSIVLFPRVDKSIALPPGFSEGWFEYCKTRLYERHTIDDSYNRYCRSFVCPITAQKFGIKPCECDKFGSFKETCEEFGGQCSCKTNVDGRKCNVCQAETYGLSASGCQNCACGQGAKNNFCNAKSGQCVCDLNSSGRTCDKCMNGYYGYPPKCDPCKCNDLATSCNTDTGYCHNCTSNTVGNNCERCLDGFYGDPADGVQCKKCMCPGIAGIQHGDSCYLDKTTGSAVCRCQPGYVGESCDRCDVFHFGNPLDAGGECKRCDCNGNVDQYNQASCDSTTGECRNCLYNTDGKKCEKCKQGYYGFPKNKLCYQCECNPYGTEGNSTVNCDDVSGQCKCLDNVEGKRCDEPAKGFFWNPNNKGGATACNCDTTGTIEASTECDHKTGQCLCNQDRGGKTCNECADRKWGDPKVGCKDCECNGPGSNSSQCHKTTGVCICKTGVNGNNCDQCAFGTKGKAPFCEPCGECFDNWALILMDIRKKLEKLEEKALDTVVGDGHNSLVDLTANIAEIEAKLNNVKLLLNGASADKIKEMEDLIKDIHDKLKMKHKALEEGHKLLDERLKELNIDEEKAEFKKTSDVLKLVFDEAMLLKESVKDGAISSIDEYVKQSQDQENRLPELKDQANKDLNDQIQKLKQEVEKLSASSNDVNDKLNDVINSAQADSMHKELSKANRNVCGGASLSCKSACGAPGCGRCGVIATTESSLPEDYYELKDTDSYADDEDCSNGVVSTLENFNLANKTFNDEYEERERNLKDKLVSLRNTRELLKISNKDLMNLKEQINEYFSKFNASRDEVLSLLNNTKFIKTNYEQLMIDLDDLLAFINSAETPHSQEDFEKIMTEIDGLAQDVMEKAEKIKEETRDSLKQALDLGAVVDKLEMEQKPVLEEIKKKEEKIAKSKEITDSNEETINAIVGMNTEVAESITEAHDKLAVVDQTRENISNWHTEYMTTIGNLKPQVQIGSLLEKTKQNDVYMIKISETLKKLEEQTRDLEEKLLQQIPVGDDKADEKRQAFKMLLELKISIEERYQQLKQRNSELDILAADNKKKRNDLDKVKSRVIELNNEASKYKLSIQEKHDFFIRCQ